jgi:hypothetical protein
MVSDWNTDFLDLIDCLNQHRAEFVVVGAFALAQHGLPRATGDLDVLVRPSAENAARVHAALRQFGAPLESSGVTAEDFARLGIVYQIGIVPRRVDVLTQLSGLDFEEAWSTRLERELDGRRLVFLGRDALIKNKRAAGRPKDLTDAAALEKLGPRRP